MSATSRTTTTRRWACLLGVLGLVAACSIGDVDVANKSCPCGSDYVCDQARNVCVHPRDLQVADSGVSTCEDCPCTADAECKAPTRPRCFDKRCVECVRTPTDTCPAGSYCNEQSQCTLGCKQESDCQISPAAPHCETTRHQCVECVDHTQCAGGTLCSSSGTCVEGCDLVQGKTCSAGKECCDGFCLDTKNDPLNCGACNTKCSTANGTPSCTAGSCTWMCASGFAHCGTGNTGCETNARTDVTHCGACDRDCNTTTVNADAVACSAGSCVYGSCKVGFGNCDGLVSNGCECACGGLGQICCPGGLCNGAALKCVGNGKCQ